MKPLVSIVIPNYNGGQFISEAISSAIEQDYPNIEIIVVDDGSTDNSLEILEAFKGRVTIIQSKNAGASSARNLGIMASKGDYIAFFDSDDIWEKNKLSLQLEFMIREQLDLVYCHGQEFGGEDGTNVFHEAIFHGDCYPDFKKFPTRAIIEMGPSTSVIRKSLLHSSGIFDTSFTGPAEDWDFFRRYCRYAKVGFCDQILVYHRNHSNNVSIRSLNEYYLGNRRALLKMFSEDSEIGLNERRLIWAKFQFISAKSFLKHGKLVPALRSIVHIFIPITF